VKAPARVLVFKVLERRGGGWHPVTGGVEAAEDYAEGAKRELQEETGFDPESGTFVDLEFSYTFDGRFGKARESAFGFILEKELEPKIDPSEHLAFEWVSGEEAIKRLQFEPQKDALKRFLCYLR
jgi:8-oxo-dGTP pyrophosphatase MutT (NUDIX family)